ncbi:MAG: gliding motility-associated C-terminal domain-containing protein [Bacteroidetes bacterium]|nr:gliding motility-associated C-terminal domain-containing protein [Bacteroidota bacterium]
MSSSNVATGLDVGNFMVVVTQANSCKDTTYFSIQGPVPITINFAVTDATCGHANGTIKVTPSGGSGIYTYDWPAINQTTDSVFGLAAGNYLVIVTDDKGCDEQVAITVSQTSPATPQPNLVTPVFYCLNENPLPLDGTPSTPTAVVNWYGTNPSGTSQPTPTVPTTNTVSTTFYYVTQTDNGCESFLDSIEVEVVAPPVVQSTVLDPDCGYLNGEIAVTVSGGGNLTYSWSPGNQTTSNITALDTGNYVLTITYGNNCQHTENFRLNPGFIPDPSVVSPVSYCLNETAQALQATASPDYVLSWYNSLTGTPQSTPITPSTNTVGSTNYYVIQNFNDCFSNPVPIEVIIKPNPQIVSPLQTVCAGNDAILTATGASTYSWRIGGNLIQGNDIVINMLYDTVYTVIGVLDGCTDSISSRVNVLNMTEPVISYTFSEKFCDTKSLDLQSNYGHGYYNTQWFYNDSLIGIGNLVNYPFVTGAGPHIIKLVVESPDGCQNSSDVEIPVTEEDFSLKIYIPNSFTPNGDRLNDTWFAVGECFREINYQIYNRWGGLITESNQMDFEWDGTENGKMLPSGVYLYVIKAKGLNYQEFVKTGQVNLIR